MDVKLLIYIYYKFVITIINLLSCSLFMLNSLSICEAFIVGEMNFKKVA